MFSSRRRAIILIIVLLLGLILSGCHSWGHKFTKHEMEYRIDVRMIGWYDEQTIEVIVPEAKGVSSYETYLIDVSDCKGYPSEGVCIVILTEHFDPAQRSYKAERVCLPSI